VASVIPIRAASAPRRSEESSTAIARASRCVHESSGSLGKSLVDHGSRQSRVDAVSAGAAGAAVLWPRQVIEGCRRVRSHRRSTRAPPRCGFEALGTMAMSSSALRMRRLIHTIPAAPMASPAMRMVRIPPAPGAAMLIPTMPAVSRATRSPICCMLVPAALTISMQSWSVTSRAVARRARATNEPSAWMAVLSLPLMLGHVLRHGDVDVTRPRVNACLIDLHIRRPRPVGSVAA